MVRIINEDFKEENRAKYDKILKSVSGKYAISEPSQDYELVGYRLIDIEPTDEAINYVLGKLESIGFEEVDRQVDEDSINDSYVVLTRENKEGRTVASVIFNAREDFAYVNCGYYESEDSEWFE